MSESERWDRAAMSAERRLADGRVLPDDFDAEDVAMAHLLNDAFHIQDEDLPPRYAQTLLGDDRYAPAADDLTSTVCTTVFERLGLAHEPISPPRAQRHRPRRYRLPEHIHRPREHAGAARTASLALSKVHKALLVMTAVVVLLAFNALFSSAAFANTLRLLITGHSGVQLVTTYPTFTPAKQVAKTVKVLPDHEILFNLQWPGDDIAGYSFTGMDIMDAEWWSNSAIIMLNYQKQDATGTHHLNILEFETRTQVALQVVQNGAAQSIPVGGSNNGIFVSGHWARDNASGMTTWQPAQRAQLICSDISEPGLITWIATDDVAGYTSTALQQRLSTIAQSLQPLTFKDFQSYPTGMNYIGNIHSAHLEQSFGGDVIDILPDAASGYHSAVYIELGSPSNQGDSGPAYSAPK